MNLRKFPYLFFFLFILSGFSGNVPEKNYVEGEVLVRFREGVVEAQDREAVRSLNLSVHRKFRICRNLYNFKVPAGAGVLQAVQTLSSDPDVLYAEPNYIYRALAVPDDTYYDERQWGLPKISAPAAWDKTTGSYDVVIAVIDSGVDYSHPDIASNMWINEAEYNGVTGEDDDANGIVDDIYGARWTDSTGIATSGDPMDTYSHGTHCAGIIGAVGNNGTGVCGVNWNVSIMALKFMSGGSGTVTDAISCIEYAADRRDGGVNVVAVSNSWGGYGYSQSLYDAIEGLKDKGILFVAAAGNDDLDADETTMYPAGYNLDNIISVASSVSDDSRSSFSNYGRTSVDIAAPGSSIYSTIPDEQYAYKSGTSMATPFVAGTAGLLSAETGETDYAQLKQWILQGVSRLHGWTNLTVTGGRLNLSESLRVGDLSAEIQPVTDFTAERDGDNVNLSWTSPAGATSIIIRRSSTVYPARWDAGTGIYEGTGTSFTDESALSGTAYYYSAWVYYGIGAGAQGIGDDKVSAAAYAYTNSPPYQPECILPEDGAEDVELPLDLTATGFADPDNDAHQASRWQVSIDDGFEYPSVDTTTSGVSSTTLDTGSLVSGTTYYWRVCYQDDAGNWSDWSDAVSFTTESGSSGGGGGGGGAVGPLAAGLSGLLTRLKKRKKKSG